MQRININAVPDGFPQVLYYSQGDIGRQFAINVADFEIPSGAVVKIQATKPSGLGFSVTGTVSGNSVTFTTTAAMTDEAGRYPAELQITSETTVIGTANITMCGEPNPHPDGTTDGQIGTIIPELTVLVERIEESNARIEEMTASAEALTPGSDPTAEYDSENNELIIGIPTAEVDEEDLLKLYIHKTATGDIATITDGADDVPMKSLKVEIVPKQSGSGDPSPSNVRTISGWDEVEVVRCGKNLFDASILTAHNWTENNGIHSGISNSINGVTLADKLPDVVTVSLKYKGETGARAGYIAFVYDDGTTDYSVDLMSSSWLSITKTSNTSKRVVRVYFDRSNSVSMNIQELQIEVGTTATSYEPYTSQSYPIPLPSTVYGGELNVVSGEGVSDMSTPIDLGDLTWRRDSNSGVYYFYATLPTPCAYSYNTPLEQLKVTALSYAYKGTVGWAYMGNKTFGFTRDTLRIRDDSYTDADTFKASLMDIDFSYGIAEPQTFQTTPTPINTLLGSNNIYSDSGSVEVEYRADTTLAYNELLEAIANL